MEDLIKYFRKIAKLHDCKLKIVRDNNGGSYYKGTITLSVNTTRNDLISTFCHELGHHKNTIEGKHKIYHTMDTAAKGVKKYGLIRFAEIMLRAEVYTEIVGSQICKDWFPGVKYETTYEYNRYWIGFVRGMLYVCA